MAFMDTSCVEDEEPAIMTAVSVHSPAMQNSKNGPFYTSYAISLKSNNTCFSCQQSCVRRRYSEFVFLRGLLKRQHPTIDPPLLPPKSYFNRFNSDFVAQRAEGLEIFLKKVLDVPMYLSNKGVHLFLQSHFTMTEINTLVTGDIPTPQLVGANARQSSFLEDSCSSVPSTGSVESRTLAPTMSVHLNIPNVSVKEVADLDSISRAFKRSCSVLESEPISIATNPELCVLVARSSSPSSSIMSGMSEKSLSSTSSSPDSERGARKVSFNEKVTVAVVKNQLWNYAVKPIKAGAC